MEKSVVCNTEKNKSQIWARYCELLHFVPDRVEAVVVNRFGPNDLFVCRNTVYFNLQQEMSSLFIVISQIAAPEIYENKNKIIQIKNTKNTDRNNIL